MITAELRASVIALRQNGRSFTEIQKDLGASSGTVCRILKAEKVANA